MTQITVPTSNRTYITPSSQFIGVLTLAAAVTLVILSVILLTAIGASTPAHNAPGEEDAASSLSQSATPTAVVTSTPIPVFMWSSTPAVVEYTIQPGDTLGSILQQFNIDDFSVVQDIIALNEIDRLPAPGTTILIPLPTLTANTRTPLSTAGVTALPPTVVPVTVMATPTPLIITHRPLIVFHEIAQGDTIASIASEYDTALQTLAELNPQLDFSGCDLTRLSGGSNCEISPILMIGDEIVVPFPPTPNIAIVTATPLPTTTSP